MRHLKNSKTVEQDVRGVGRAISGANRVSGCPVYLAALDSHSCIRSEVKAARAIAPAVSPDTFEGGGSVANLLNFAKTVEMLEIGFGSGDAMSLLALHLAEVRYTQRLFAVGRPFAFSRLFVRTGLKLRAGSARDKTDALKHARETVEGIARSAIGRGRLLYKNRCACEAHSEQTDHN